MEEDFRPLAGRFDRAFTVPRVADQRHLDRLQNG